MYVLYIMQTFGVADAWDISYFSRCVVEEVSTKTISSTYISRDGTFYILGLCSSISLCLYILQKIGIVYLLFTEIIICQCFFCIKRK